MSRRHHKTTLPKRKTQNWRRSGASGGATTTKSATKEEATPRQNAEEVAFDVFLLSFLRSSWQLTWTKSHRSMSLILLRMSRKDILSRLSSRGGLDSAQTTPELCSFAWNVPRPSSCLRFTTRWQTWRQLPPSYKCLVATSCNNTNNMIVKEHAAFQFELHQYRQIGQGSGFVFNPRALERVAVFVASEDQEADMWLCE